MDSHSTVERRTGTSLPATSARVINTRRRYVSAAQVIGVGLICFAAWLFVDARQLYESAQTSPLGVRRSTAIAVLRPIARVNEWLGVDRIINSANRALGRGAGTPGGAQAGASAPSAANGSIRRGVGAGKLALGSHPAGIPLHTAPKGVSVLPAIPQPTKRHPLTVLQIGDSIGEDLGDGLADAIGSNPAVHLIQASVGNTGLANAAYYDWPRVLANDLQQYHPEIVIVLLGGNDWQSFQVTPTRNATVGTLYWKTQYASRVATMMQEATAAGAHMIWVGLPIMGPQSPFPPSMPTTLDAIYSAEAKVHPNVIYLSSWSLFSTPSGGYAAYGTTAKGSLVALRDPDGVHLALPGGSDRLADAVVASIAQSLHLKI